MKPPPQDIMQDMTPSDAHDSGWQRDPGHDEMQMEVFRWLVWRDQVSTYVKKRYSNDESELAILDTRELEYLIEVNDRIVGFVDICERFSTDGKSFNDRQFSFTAWEIKPKIHSVGAILRQAKVLREKLWRWRPSRDSYSSPYVRIMVVVSAKDPKTGLLQEAMKLSRIGSVVLWGLDGSPIKQENAQ
jgi:hypothetical protein